MNHLSHPTFKEHSRTLGHGELPSLGGVASAPDDLTTTFVSPTHGFSPRHMEGRRPTPAMEPWDPVIDPPVDTTSTYDDPFDLWETGYGAFFKSASTEIPKGGLGR